MQSKWHILIGFVFSYALVCFFNFSIFSGIIIFLSSWMIDGDHYLWYGLAMRDWNPVAAIRWNNSLEPKWYSLSKEQMLKFKLKTLICHGILFWAILFLLSYIHIIFLWVLIGVAIHMVADWVDLIKHKEPLYYKILPCLTFIRNKKKKPVTEL